ncbi:FAD binding domain-containing protein [Agromyces seonyuensis]|uniref:FAD-binding molybdopterin dehydrogenase n=1 Tax=Agromyces seonyuensis TaxID=2662446 RepID=A0A6I4NSU4_9MICO|nr:FAD binding domain-containing protein [Agromyces seonyuensis]MWB97526.1 FAD-binding molybdopterin dehydrogenase [Agromyces seonyuensis]
MDLTAVDSLRIARTPGDLVLAPGEAWLAGGSWLFSEPQPETTGLVDLMGLGWTPVEELPGGGLRVAATCTIAELSAAAPSLARAAAPLLEACCRALLGSFKVWNVATVGGNLANSLPAGPMISLGVALDGELDVWGPDDAERRIPVADFVTGVNANVLAPGEVIRALDIPAHALDARPAMRKTSLLAIGRSSALVTGRLDADGATTIGVTAATSRPEVLRFAALPDADVLEAALDGIGTWFDDPHGTADWREGITRVLAREVVAELGDPDAAFVDGTAVRP